MPKLETSKTKSQEGKEKVITYRVTRKIIQESALSITPKKGYMAKIGKLEQYFNLGEEKKVAEWATGVWAGSGKPTEENTPCLVFVLKREGGKVLYASYRPKEMVVI